MLYPLVHVTNFFTMWLEIPAIVGRLTMASKTLGVNGLLVGREQSEENIVQRHGVLTLNVEILGVDVSHQIGLCVT